MLPILICEGSEYWLQKMYDAVEKTVETKGYQMEVIISGHRPVEILRYLNGKNSIFPAMYFIDADLETRINSYDLGKRIQSRDRGGYLLYTTIKDDIDSYMYVYGLTHLRTIPKKNPLQLQESVCENLTYVHKQYQEQFGFSNHMIKIKVGNKIKGISADEIRYAEVHITDAYKIVIHTDNEAIESRMSLDELQKAVGPLMFRCHPNFLTGRQEILRYNRQTRRICTKNGQEYMIPSKSWRGFLQWL